jgi:hypothetical protein
MERQGEEVVEEKEIRKREKGGDLEGEIGDFDFGLDPPLTPPTPPNAHRIPSSLLPPL